MSGWILFGLFVAWVLAAMVLIGSRLPKTHIAASRIRLRAPPAEVWRIISDLPSHPDWRPGLQGVVLGPEIDGLPSWYEVCSAHLRVKFRVLESDPPRRLVTCLAEENAPLLGTWVYELREADGGTELTITEKDRIFNPILRFFAKFVISYYGVMDVFLVSLARRLGEDALPEHLSLKLGAPVSEP